MSYVALLTTAAANLSALPTANGKNKLGSVSDADADRPVFIPGPGHVE